MRKQYKEMDCPVRIILKNRFNGFNNGLSLGFAKEVKPNHSLINAFLQSG